MFFVKRLSSVSSAMVITLIKLIVRVLNEESAKSEGNRATTWLIDERRWLSVLNKQAVMIQKNVLIGVDRSSSTEQESINAITALPCNIVAITDVNVT